MGTISEKGYADTKILIVTCYLLPGVIFDFRFLYFLLYAKIYSEHGKHGTNENNNPHNADLRPEGAGFALSPGHRPGFCIQCDFIRPERAKASSYKGFCPDGAIVRPFSFPRRRLGL